MIRELILARALELAAHDGVPVTVVHLHGAASNLVGEIAREKDAAVADLVLSTAATIPSPPDAPDASAEIGEVSVAGDLDATSAPAKPPDKTPAAAPAEPFQDGAAAPGEPAGDASAEQVPA